MKKMLMFVLCSAVLCGCATHTGKVVSKDTPFDDMQKQAAKLVDDGLLAAVGIGQSRDMQLALNKAKVDARKNLAQVVQVKVESLEKQFAEEVGEGMKSEINTLFSSAAKILTNQKLVGSAPKKQIFTEKEGIVTAYVLMMVNPELVAGALQEQAAKSSAVYERFRASQAFDELNKEINAYEEKEADALRAFMNK